MNPVLAANLSAPTAVPAHGSNSLATWGLVLSCFSFICCGCVPASVLGVIFSIIGLQQANRDPAQTGRPVAIAGIIIGALALLGMAIAVAMGLLGNIIEQFQK